MTTLLRRRARPEEGHPADLETPRTPEEDAPAAVEWTGPAAWMTKLTTWGLLACLTAGPVALGLAGWMVWTLMTQPSPVSVESDTTARAGEQTSVEAFATDFVVTWLTTTTGQEKRLTPFVGSSSGLVLPEKPWLVWDAAPADAAPVEGISVGSAQGNARGNAQGNTAAVEATSDEPGVWTVTVAATVAETNNAPAVRRYFQVPVAYKDGAMAAQAFPAPVAAPQTAEAPRLAYRYPVALSDPVSAASAEFLSALLVGGDVTRVISPGAQIRAISPAPYTVAEVEEVRVDEDLTELPKDLPDGQEVHVLVTATATPKASAGALSVQYALTLTARDGRWEVSSHDPAPSTLPPDSEDSTGSQDTSIDPGTGSPSTAPTTQPESQQSDSPLN